MYTLCGTHGLTSSMCMYVYLYFTHRHPRVFLTTKTENKQRSMDFFLIYFMNLFVFQVHILSPKTKLGTFRYKFDRMDHSNGICLVKCFELSIGIVFVDDCFPLCWFSCSQEVDDFLGVAFL